MWCWRRLLRVSWTARRSNQSILKEISPEYSLEGLLLKLKLQYFGDLMQRTDSLEKTLMLERLKVGGEGDDRGWDGWMALLTQWTWVWVNSGSWWWTGRPDVLQSMGSQRVGHDWVTELNWTDRHSLYFHILFWFALVPFMIPSALWVFFFPSLRVFKTVNLKSLSGINSVCVFSCQVVSKCLWSHRLRHARPPSPSPSPGACPSSCPLSPMLFHPLILCHPLLFLLSIFPSIRVFSSGCLHQVAKVLGLQL